MGKHAQNHVLGDTPRVKEYTTQRPFKVKNNLSPKTEPLNLYEPEASRTTIVCTVQMVANSDLSGFVFGNYLRLKSIFVRRNLNLQRKSFIFDPENYVFEAEARRCDQSLCK